MDNSTPKRTPKAPSKLPASFAKQNSSLCCGHLAEHSECPSCVHVNNGGRKWTSHYSYKMTEAISLAQDEERNLERNNPRDVNLPCSENTVNMEVWFLNQTVRTAQR